MKYLLAFPIVAVALAASSYAKEVVSPEELAARKAERQAEFDIRTGGRIVKPGTQQGEIVYADCQTRIPKAWIEESVAYFAKETRFKISLKGGTSFDLNNPKIEGNATLFIIDDASLPTILVAPENRWAFVNIAPIAKEQRPAFFEARVKKELSRGFAYLCGAANSQYQRALTRGIVNHADLDKNPDLSLPVDVIQRFKGYMETLDVRPAIMTTYKKACQEGWAPAPTNEFQKAIWDKVHAMPSEPLKIKPEEKKVSK
jgi:hypothetical protein